MNKSLLMKLSAIYLTTNAMTGCVAPQGRTVVIERNLDGTTTTNVVESAQQQSAMSSIGNGIVGFMDGVEGTVGRYQNTIGTTLGIANTVNGFRQTSALQHIASNIKGNTREQRKQTNLLGQQNNLLETFLNQQKKSSCNQ